MSQSLDALSLAQETKILPLERAFCTAMLFSETADRTSYTVSHWFSVKSALEFCFPGAGTGFSLFQDL